MRTGQSGPPLGGCLGGNTPVNLSGRGQRECVSKGRRETERQPQGEEDAGEGGVREIRRILWDLCLTQRDVEEKGQRQRDHGLGQTQQVSGSVSVWDCVIPSSAELCHVSCPRPLSLVQGLLLQCQTKALEGVTGFMCEVMNTRQSLVCENEPAEPVTFVLIITTVNNFVDQFASNLGLLCVQSLFHKLHTKPELSECRGKIRGRKGSETFLFTLEQSVRS